jgi:hypothetical protein
MDRKKISCNMPDGNATETFIECPIFAKFLSFFYSLWQAMMQGFR